ncbi:Tat (twin-arginine translocation) pathway signal sequence [Micrococcus lylae]|uniref:Tat (twin-arginine translocation) pathway signal sequence n=1 Tax=Micrococcus lylae TaxID=1273 RepID=UPI002155F19C|nr:Tat (twin-arginine translocation) pathway signal sequence [Micrococcus lylae]WIK82625.1 Tat (twin-arginine translocation) pathway signal sequence [Micrococcus lylae]
MAVTGTDRTDGVPAAPDAAAGRAGSGTAARSLGPDGRRAPEIGLGRAVGILVRLRWALMVSGWRRSTATFVFSIIGVLYFGGLTLLASAAVVFAPAPESTALRAAVTTLFCAGLVLGWSLVAPFITGVDATLDPRSFQPYPIRRLPLVTGLLVGRLTTPQGVLTLVFALAVGVSWRDHPAALPWGLAGGVLTAATALALAYGVTAVLSSYTGQRRIRDIVSVLVFIPLMLGGVVLNRIADSFDQLVALAEPVAAVLAWTPFGAAGAAAGAAASGAHLTAAVHLAVGLAWLAAAVALWAWGLQRTVEPVAEVGGRRRASSGDATARERPLRWIGRPATGPVTAIAARCQRYWFTDPRYSATLVVVPLFAVILWFLGSRGDVGGGPLIPTMLLLGPMIAWTMGVAVSADIAYDHTAFHHHVTAGVRGADDRWGRVLGMGVLGVPATLLGAVGSVALYGMWDHLAVVLGASVGTLACVTGMASLLSARLVYAVPKPGDSPFATPQGAGMRTVVVQMASLLLSLLITLPITACVVAYLLLGMTALWGAVTLAVGLLWGGGVLLLGVRLGGRWLDRTAAETYQTVARF